MHFFKFHRACILAVTRFAWQVLSVRYQIAAKSQILHLDVIPVCLAGSLLSAASSL
ncbi:MAG: hypothetical protein ACI31F_08280 [Muribaculaceae bacterium]